MGKLATMILWGSLKLGVPLLATLLLLQTGCLYLTTVYADFEPDVFNHHHVSQVTQGYFEPYLVNYYDDTHSPATGDVEEEADEDENDALMEDENNASEKVSHFKEFHESGSDSKNAIIIQDFISLSSSKVLMKVKDSESGPSGNDNNHPESILRLYSPSTTTNAGESSNVMSEEEQLHKLEKKFLSLFGMASRPKRKKGAVVGKRSVPKELLDLYEKQSNPEFHTTDLFLPGKLTRNANTVRVINPQEATFIDRTTQLHALLKFDLSPTSIPANEKITGAELRLPFSITLPPQDPADQVSIDIASPSVFARVLLHDIIKPPPRSRFFKDSLQTTARTFDHNNNKPMTHVIDSKLVYLSNRKYSTFWLTFDILPAVLRWMDTGRARNLTTVHNYGVALEIVGLKGEKHEEIKGGQQFNMKLKDDKEMISLFLYSDDGHNAKARRRSKRDASNGSGSKKSSQRKLRRAAQHQYHHQQQYYRNHNQHHYHHQQYGSGRRRKPHRHKNRRRNLCSKKPMFVDFTDVGWNDWIVAPPGYQAYYCSGECPFPMAEHLNATNHAVIQALINSMNPSLVPPPCCVPNKYSSLSLLYTDSSDRIVLKNYNEMVVDSCGCS